MKTGMHKSSQTVNESKRNNVFQFTTSVTRDRFILDEKRTFIIKNAWVETAWFYDCVNNKAVIKKDTFSQFVIEGEYSTTIDSLSYLLMKPRGRFGCYLGGELSFNYSGDDTIKLVLKNSKSNAILDTMKFIRLMTK